MTGLLRSTLEEVSGIDEAYLYGSFAQDREDSTSDIDILLIGQPDASDLETRLRGLERKLGRDVNYVTMSREELNEKLKAGDTFVRQVWQEKRIQLIPPLSAGDRTCPAE